MADSSRPHGIFTLLSALETQLARHVAIAFDPGSAASLARRVDPVARCILARAMSILHVSVQDVAPGEEHTTVVALVLWSFTVIMRMPGERCPSLVDLGAVAAFKHYRNIGWKN